LSREATNPATPDRTRSTQRIGAARARLVRDRSIGGHFSTAQVPVGNLPTVRESHLRSREMNLYLRKVVHPQAHDNYRVVFKLDGDEFEIGSIGIQHGAAWRWGIDTVIPMRVLETQGKGKNRRDCMKWDRFAGDEANLVEFLNAKRKRR
jgi:hypothetical protein